MDYRKIGTTLASLFFLLIMAGTAANAQQGLQSPEQFLGYELGAQWTPHHRVLGYFRHVAANSPMVELQQYGTTNEGRELVIATVASPENMKRLEEIRANNLKRTGLLEGEPSGDQTAIVWLSYNVHGNETSSSEAALKTIYELVRPGNSESKQWLRNTVVIMDPMINPDGRDRYVHWYKETAGDRMNTNMDAREHDEPWPGGRTNHYYFDLNRDWAWLTQKESRARIDIYQQWMPHIHVDFHEQGINSPYYFAPAAVPFHKAITEWQREFQFAIGKNHARYFDRNGWLYFTREVFDLFYPSYGDTYPIFNGAIGMTYEQAGGGSAGLGVIKEEGDTLSLYDRLIHHHTTGMSTVEVTSNNAGRVVSEFADYFQTSMNNPAGEYKSYVIRSDTTDRLLHLFNLLDRHRVQYGVAEDDGTYAAYNYRTGQSERVRVRPGDFVVSAYQPKSVLARIFFEPRPELEDSLTYDITAWSLPYAYGLEAWAVEDRIEARPAHVEGKPVDAPAEMERPYAYLAEWKDLGDVNLLTALLKKNIVVRYATEPFSIGGNSYGRGTLVITRAGNKNLGGRFDEMVRSIASEQNQEIVPVATGFVSSGSDFGSSSVRFLERPHIALLSGSGTSSNNVGEIWHYFDRQVNYPVTLIDTDRFGRVDLDDYDVLILPSGYYGGAISDSRLDEIRQWVSRGGRLIAVQGANDFLAGKDGFGLKEKERSEDEEDQDEPAVETQDPYAQRERERIPGSNPGSIYRVAMDPTHPLAFGYGSEYFSLKLDTDSYAFLEDGWNVGVVRGEALMSGFTGHEAQQELENTLAFGVQGMGGGAVVYMVDNPLFRAFWYNGKLLFSNAVFLVGQ